MADDIVTRLRNPDFGDIGESMLDAADEIERLRSRLATADDLIEALLDQHCQDRDTPDDWWSGFITINAEAIRYMGSIGRCTVEANGNRVAYGRRPKPGGDQTQQR